MTDAFETIVHSLQVSLDVFLSPTPQQFFETSYEVLKSGFDVAYTFVSGLVIMLWHTLESFAEFLGASVNFVVCEYALIPVPGRGPGLGPGRLPGSTSLCTVLPLAANIVILILLFVGLFVYRSRASPVRVRSKGKKAE